MQQQTLTFARKICKSDARGENIEVGDVVNVRLREACGSCCVTPEAKVPSVSPGCDNQATLDAHSSYVLNDLDTLQCVGSVVPLIVTCVHDEGHGFSWDRSVEGQDFRASDVEMVMPEHNCTCEGGSALP